MKKVLLALVASGLFLASCSTYTCPTYTKAPLKNEAAEICMEAKV